MLWNSEAQRNKQSPQRGEGMIERATPILGVSLQPKRFVTSFPNMKYEIVSLQPQL